MRLFVSNIDFGAEESDLRALFIEGGYLPDSVKIIHDRDTGQSRGFGFVELDNVDVGQAAIQAMDGKKLNGRRLNVRQAEGAPSRGGRDRVREREARGR